jgi:DNA-binding HxlR family transcriptional regulator
MSKRFAYASVCGKWKSLILTVVSKKPKRFNKIKQLCFPVNSNTLARCLKQLEQDGLVVKKESTHTTYFVTPVGAKISKLLLQINELLLSLD